MIVGSAKALPARGALEAIEIEEAVVANCLPPDRSGSAFTDLLEAKCHFAGEDKCADEPPANEAMLISGNDQIALGRLCFVLAANGPQPTDGRSQSDHHDNIGSSQVRSKSAVLEPITTTLEAAACAVGPLVLNAQVSAITPIRHSRGILEKPAVSELNGLDVMVARATVTTHRHPIRHTDVQLIEPKFAGQEPALSLENTHVLANPVQRDNLHSQQQDHGREGTRSAAPDIAGSRFLLDERGEKTHRNGNVGEPSVASLDDGPTKKVTELHDQPQVLAARARDERVSTIDSVAGPLADVPKTSKQVIDVIVQAHQTPTKTEIEKDHPLQPQKWGLMKVIDLALVPAQLGEVRVRLRYTGEAVTVEITASDAGAVRQLRDECTELEDGLRAKHIRVDEIIIGALDSSFGSAIRKADRLPQGPEGHPHSMRGDFRRLRPVSSLARMVLRKIGAMVHISRINRVGYR